VKNRDSIVVRIARAFQKIPLGPFEFIERVYVSNKCDVVGHDIDMIVLLAAPRSGSTLSYQCFIEATNVIGLTNISNLFFRIPFLSLMLQLIVCRKKKGKFLSNEGYVGGFCGASEGLMFWGKWTSSPIDERDTVSDFNNISYFKKVVSYVNYKTKRPLMSGYLGHVLNDSVLYREFANVRFVVLLRNPMDTALSLLNLRISNPDEWLSVFPRECEHVVRSDVYEQVAAQIYWTNRRLLNVIKKYKSPVLHYEKLCSNPNEAIGRVVAELSESGSNVCVKSELPIKFGMRKSDPDTEAYIELKRRFEVLESRYGRLEFPC